MSEKLQELMRGLNYTFQKMELLDQALHHRSAGTPNNERLEFLGDSVLGFVISLELYQRYPDLKEGELSRLRASLVNREVLAELALELSLNDYLFLSAGERKSGGEQRPSILADVMEAVIGAIYLDGGLALTQACITRWFREKVDDLSHLTVVKDPKSALQEWLQSHKFPLPHYAVIASGRAHEQEFHVTCTVVGLPHHSEGTSHTRRKAEQIAAQHFLELLHEK